MVAAFIRSIIGIERKRRLKYRELIKGTEMTRMQEEYLRNLIRYVSENGDIRTKLLNPTIQQVSLRYLSKAITP